MASAAYCGPRSSFVVCVHCLCCQCSPRNTFSVKKEKEEEEEDQILSLSLQVRNWRCPLRPLLPALARKDEQPMNEA
jgi:hypothetical protein